MMSSNGESKKKSELFIGMVPIFPEEIFEDILVWLPVLSLLRFKCVCKPWYSLISSNRFIQAHLMISKKHGNFHSQRVLFIEKLGHTTSLMNCSFLPHESGTVEVAVDSSSPVHSLTYIDFIGTCNGLICILFKGCIYLCNLSTRDVKELPDIDGCWLSNVMHGLGFDEANEDYKVVCVTEKDFGHVYSLKSNSWKQVVMLEEYITYLGHKRGIFVNQKLHWIKDIGSNKYEIVSFDLVNEIWEKMEIPNFYGQDSCLCLVPFGFGGCLSLLCIQRNLVNGSPCSVHLWILNEYGNSQSWKKLLRLPHLETRLKLEFAQGEIELDRGPNDALVLLDNWTRDLILYDLRNNSLAHRTRMDSIYRKCEDDDVVMECLIYLESLVPL